MLGILITIFTSGAIMVGVTQAKSSLRAIQIEELAFDYIQGFTEKMKSRISANAIPSIRTDCEKECLEADEEDNCIIYADVLEHLIDPWELLIKHKFKLSDDGCIIASIPNIAHYKIIKNIKVFFYFMSFYKYGFVNKSNFFMKVFFWFCIN